MHRSQIVMVALLGGLVLGEGADVDAAQGPRDARQPVIRRVYRARNKTKLPASWTIAGNDYNSSSEYLDLRNGCMELLRRYPPNKYFFVGLGRDGAPVVAFLQNLGEKNLAVNLPGTSNVGWQGESNAVVRRYVEAAIPERILKGERTIVIMDVTSSGKSPALFGPLLERYLRSRGNKRPVVRLAFSWVNLKREGGYSDQLTDYIHTAKFPDFENYYTGKYEGSWTEDGGGDGIGEHESHSMESGLKPPRKTNPNYRAFRRALMARMEQDRVLDAFVSRLPRSRRLARPEKPPAPWPPKLDFELAPERAANQPTALLTIENKVNEKGKAKKGNGQDRRKAKAKAKPTQAAQVAPATQAPKLAEAQVEGKGGAKADADEEQPSSYEYLSVGEYAQLRDGALKIMKMAPPSKAYLIGVGRSSSALVAFLENLGRDVATYLPADGLQKLAKGKGSATAPAALDELFDAFIPQAALRGSRTIVLFQRSESGVSLPYLQAALTQYLQLKGSPAEVAILALGEAKPEEGRFLNVSRSPELKRLNDRKYHLVAPYAYFRPGRHEVKTVLAKNGKPTKRSDVYEEFKRRIRQRMIGDAVLGQAMKAMPQ